MRNGKHPALSVALAIGLGMAWALLDQPPAREASAPDPRASALVEAAGAAGASGRLATATEVGEPSRTPRPDGDHRLSGAADAGSAAAAARAMEPGDPLAQEPAAVRARAPALIVLEPLAVPPGVVTASLSGFDAGAPRELEVWAVFEGRAWSLGRAASDSGARIHALQLPLPGSGLEVVVTPRGVRPGQPGASAPLRIARASEPIDPSEAPTYLPRWRLAPAEGGTLR